MTSVGLPFRNLQAARSDLGLSQEGLANLLDMSRSMIQKYEYGEYPIPRIVWLAVMALYFAHYADELAGLDHRQALAIREYLDGETS